jgi:hypothetical protein
MLNIALRFLCLLGLHDYIIGEGIESHTCLRCGRERT